MHFLAGMESAAPPIPFSSTVTILAQRLFTSPKLQVYGIGEKKAWQLEGRGISDQEQTRGLVNLENQFSISSPQQTDLSTWLSVMSLIPGGLDFILLECELTGPLNLRSTELHLCYPNDMQPPQWGHSSTRSDMTTHLTKDLSQSTCLVSLVNPHALVKRDLRFVYFLKSIMILAACF